MLHCGSDRIGSHSIATQRSVQAAHRNKGDLCAARLKHMGHAIRQGV